MSVQRNGDLPPEWSNVTDTSAYFTGFIPIEVTRYNMKSVVCPCNAPCDGLLVSPSKTLPLVFRSLELCTKCEYYLDFLLLPSLSLSAIKAVC